MGKVSKVWSLALICSMILLVGCGNTASKAESTKEEIKYADKEFVVDMAKGLQARWKLNDADEKKEGYDDIPLVSKEWQDMMLSYIDAELNFVEKYKNEKFEDGNLQEIAVKYNNLLNQHKKICTYMTVDYNKYEEEFEPIYNERSKIISDLVENYGLSVDEKYQSTLDDFLTNSQLVAETEVNQEQVSKLIGSIQFSLVEEDDSEYKQYAAVVENTTDINFSTLQLNINLLDAEGVILESTYASVDNFSKGKKARFEFGTDKIFASTEVQCEYWEEQ